jgi:hypothetical protein
MYDKLNNCITVTPINRSNVTPDDDGIICLNLYDGLNIYFIRLCPHQELYWTGQLELQ